MLKVFAYEWKRAAWNWLALAALALLLYFANGVISGTVLYGVNETGPFSEWTYLTYQGRLSSLLLVYPLYCIARMFSPKEKRVRKLTEATPVKGSVNMAIKLSAVSTIYWISLVLSTGLIFGYYGLLFGPVAEVPYWELIQLTVLFSVPLMLISLGGAILAGRVSPSLVYVLMGLLVFANFIDARLPMALDILGTSLLTLGEAGTLAKGEIAFTVPETYLTARIGMAVIGVMLMALACKLEDRKG